MMPPSEPVRCVRCTLPVEPAVVGRYLRADRDGVCDFCRAWDAREARFPGGEAARARLDALVARARRRRGRYDALVPISGGKDSLAVLDFVRHEYPDLRILAVTLDNGLLADHVLPTCRGLCDDLGVEHVVWEPPGIRRLARLFLQKTGHFCCPCEVALMDAYYHLTRLHRIPLVFLGSSARHDGAHPEAANPWTPPFFDRVVRGEPGAASLRDRVCRRGLLFRFGFSVLSRRVRVVLLPDLVDWDVRKNRVRLASRYGIPERPDHADCVGAAVADWLYKRRCGFGQKAATLAAGVRDGRIPRAEALALLADSDEFGGCFPESEARDFLDRLGMTADEVVRASTQKPDPYFGPLFRLVGLARRVAGLSIA